MGWLSLVSETRNEIAKLGIQNFHMAIEKFKQGSVDKLRRKDVVIALANCGHTPGRKASPLDFIGPFIISRIRSNRAILKCPHSGRTLNRNLRAVRKMNLNEQDKAKILAGRYSIEEGTFKMDSDSELEEAQKESSANEPLSLTKESKRSKNEDKLESVDSKKVVKDKEKPIIEKTSQQDIPAELEKTI